MTEDARAGSGGNTDAGGGSPPATAVRAAGVPRPPVAPAQGGSAAVPPA
ncbi:hypothetical protein [Streptomyces fungicidicus]